MAERVVDVLEAIEVDGNHRVHGTRRCQPRSIAKARKRIVVDAMSETELVPEFPLALSCSEEEDQRQNQHIDDHHGDPGVDISDQPGHHKPEATDPGRGKQRVGVLVGRDRQHRDRHHHRESESAGQHEGNDHRPDHVDRGGDGHDTIGLAELADRK